LRKDPAQFRALGSYNFLNGVGAPAGCRSGDHAQAIVNRK
jgi:hypothetical protein